MKQDKGKYDGGRVDRASKLPLYMQFKNIIIEKLRNGELKPGSIVKPEFELCEEYGISRYPVRQAMEELVAEGYLTRTRGKGTFVSKELPNMLNSNTKVLGLILNHLTSGFNGSILSGFEKQARKRGYLTAACCSEGLPDEEMNCIDILVGNGVSGIFVFPCDESRIGIRLKELESKGIYLGLIDRNPGIPDIDYIGSDNFGGSYSAVRHAAMQGFENVIFVTDRSGVSSVKERMEGFDKAVEHFNLNKAAGMDSGGKTGKLYSGNDKYLVNRLQEEISSLKMNIPFSIIAVNDFTAIRCMDMCVKEGLIIGKDVAIVGFDNIEAGYYQATPLTTVAQNGLLLGSSAADTAIDKLEQKTNRIYRRIIPTQLVIRSSCGERLV